MCGIVGIIGSDWFVEILLNGFKSLEYWGYDFVGIYVNDQVGYDYFVKCLGWISNLESVLMLDVYGLVGIGYICWVIYGELSEVNVYLQYFMDECFYLVYNGVIENYK